MEKEKRTFQGAIRVLPPELRQKLLDLPEEIQSTAEEVRLRIGWPVSVVVDGMERETRGVPVCEAHMEQLLEYATESSLHTALPQLRRGYLSIAGGHRLGLCGRAVLREGELVNLRPLSSAALRIAREVRGAADPILKKLCPNGRLASTLILAPPGVGKTTLLRDVIRQVSEGCGCQPLRISLVDERGEVAALWNGRAQLEVGRRTDVLEGCPKGLALMWMLRAMNPQVLAVDEITDREDTDGLIEAVGCGVTLLASAHGECLEDLKRRKIYRPLLREGVFQRVVRIERGESRRIYTVEELV